MPEVAPRTVVVDAGLGLLLGWFGWVGAAYTWDRPEVHRGPPPWGDSTRYPGMYASEAMVPFLIMVAVGVTIRRVWPRAGFCAVVVGLGGYLALGGPLGPVCLALTATVFAMATALPLRRWAPLTALLVPLVLAAHWSEPFLGLFDPGVYAAGLAVFALAVLPVMFALLRRARRDNDRREREQDRRRYVDEERLRIAREVHDVVGHSLTVITMQAGVALHVLEKQPDQVAASLEAIRTTSLEALAELRTTLAVFREADGGAPRGPRPGLDRLDDLVGALVGAGRQVQLVRDGLDRALLPTAVDQAAFRIVQEALTNVVRHAGPAAATVRLEQRPDRLDIEVLDDGSTRTQPVEGDGLRGMRERAAAVGGSIQLSPGHPTGLRVTAVLPLPLPGPR